MAIPVLTPNAQANRLWLNRSTDSGVRFARRPIKTEKAIARNCVLSAFGQNVTGGRDAQLNILTMPGLDWSFERALIANREHGRGRERPRTTFITAIESSPAIYTAALRLAPGADNSISTAVKCPPYARAAARTYAITRYYLTTFEEMALADTWHFEGAWLDFTGPLTISRLAGLEALWPRLGKRLVLTTLNARWTREIGAMICEAGGLADLLLDHLPGAVVVSNLLYADGSPMNQITIDRAESRRNR